MEATLEKIRAEREAGAVGDDGIGVRAGIVGPVAGFDGQCAVHLMQRHQPRARRDCLHGAGSSA